MLWKNTAVTKIMRNWLNCIFNSVAIFHPAISDPGEKPFLFMSSLCFNAGSTFTEITYPPKKTEFREDQNRFVSLLFVPIQISFLHLLFLSLFPAQIFFFPCWTSLVFIPQQQPSHLGVVELGILLLLERWNCVAIQDFHHRQLMIHSNLRSKRIQLFTVSQSWISSAL